MIENVAAAPVDELQQAKHGEAKAETVFRRLVDVLGRGDAFLDHAGGLVHGQRLDARDDVSGAGGADDGDLADGFQQGFQPLGRFRVALPPPGDSSTSGTRNAGLSQWALRNRPGVHKGLQFVATGLSMWSRR